MLALRNPMFADLFASLDGSADRNSIGWRWQTFSPAADVQASEKGYLIELDVPGLTEKELELVLESQHLTVRGERKPVENATYSRSERTWGRFERVFHLPEDADVEKLDASVRNGVLTVSVPRAESAKPRSITVRTAE